MYLLTSGGPGTSTELINLHLYKVFFEQNQLGYGALLSLAVIAAIVAFLLVSRRATAALAVHRVSPHPAPFPRRDERTRESQRRPAEPASDADAMKNAPTTAASSVRAGIAGYALVALALAVVVGPFLWILTASFKHQIAIYSGQFPFTPTLSNFQDVLFGRRSDFAANIVNSRRRGRHEYAAGADRRHARRVFAAPVSLAEMGFCGLSRMDAGVPHGAGADADRTVVHRVPRARAVRHARRA